MNKENCALKLVDEIILFSFKLSALKSTGNYSCDAWRVDDPAGHQIQKFL